jgi:hypothetical protein
MRTSEGFIYFIMVARLSAPTDTNSTGTPNSFSMNDKYFLIFKGNDLYEV